MQGFWTRVRLAVPRWGRATLKQDASHPHIDIGAPLGQFLPSRTTPQNIEGADTMTTSLLNLHYANSVQAQRIRRGRGAR